MPRSRGGSCRRLRAALVLWLLFVTAAAWPRAASQVLIVVGPGGEAEYDQLFAQWAGKLKEALGPKVDGVTLLAPGTESPSSRERLLATLAGYEKLEASDQLAVFLIGHGSADQERYRINLPGPDLSGDELGAALAGIKARLVVVNGTSCRGASLTALSAKNRAVVTATRSGRETTPPRFMGFLIEGLDGRADTDKNGMTTVLELFHYARQKTAEWYQSQNRLASEHALLDDSGSGRGSDNPAPGSEDGALAAALAISRPSVQADAGIAPELVRRKQDLEGQIESLRFRKTQMADAEYQEQFEKLMVELAQINRQIAEARK